MASEAGPGGTSEFSEEEAYKLFIVSQPYAVAVKCAGSNCDRMSFYTCAVK